MFESDGDLDFDQNFLNEVDEKVSQFYSQIITTTDVGSAKRRKSEISESSVSMLNINEKKSTFGKQNEKTSSQSTIDKASRTNLVLGLLNKDCSNKSESQSSSITSQYTLDSHNISKQASQGKQNEKDNLSRKNLVLGILQKKNVTPEQKTDSSLCTTNKKVSPIVHKSGEEKGPIKPQVKSSLPLKSKEHPQNIIKSTGNKEPKPSTSNGLRKQMILELLNQYPAREKKQKEGKVKHDSSEVQVSINNEKVTLVRKFPGPAGLLPDKVDDSIPPVAYWNSIEEDDRKSKKAAESNLSEFCSQNTKNLFSEGAWQQMLEELPANFLNGREIAALKSIANMNHKRSTKVEFLAGIIERIDHIHDNPLVVLKDFTDSIQGIVHRDIVTKYPGLLEQNVVLLLHDISLLRISGYLGSSKYHILISLSSLLAIYSANRNTVHTPNMKIVLGNNLSGRTREECVSETIAHKNSLNTVSNQSTVKHSSNTSSSAKEIDNNEENAIFDDAVDLFNFDDTNEFSFCVSSSEVTNSQNTKNFTSQTLKDKNSPSTKLKNLLQSSRRFPSCVNNKKVRTSSTSKDLNIKSSLASSLSKKRTVSDLDSSDINFDDSILNATDEFQEDSDKFNEEPDKVDSTIISSKSLQLKNCDFLVPSQLNNTPKHDRKSQQRDSCLEDQLYQSSLKECEINSDDEMLSQLDVDTILSNCNEQN